MLSAPAISGFTRLGHEQTTHVEDVLHCLARVNSSPVQDQLPVMLKLSIGCRISRETAVLQDINLARWLLDHGMNPTAGFIPSSTPHSIGENGDSKGYLLYFASIFSSLETFKLFQSRGANLEYSHALHGAAGPGGPSQIPIIRHLLDGGYLDVNELDVYHIPHAGTPLMAAITGGNFEVVRVLLEFDANPYASRTSPFEATVMGMAQGFAGRDAEASREIVDTLTETMAYWDGDPGDAPVSVLAPFPKRKTRGRVER